MGTVILNVSHTGYGDTERLRVCLGGLVVGGWGGGGGVGGGSSGTPADPNRKRI